MAAAAHLLASPASFFSLQRFPSSAASPLDWSKVFTDGDFNAGVRYRLERVRQDGIDDEATASTGRLRLGWVSGPLSGFSVGVETDYVFVIAFDDYNSTVNGETRYPIVADPDGFDLNQLFLRYGTENLHASLGRQRINHGAQRIVGGVAWRQNEQTFDAFRLQREGRLSLDYAYVWQVNRIFGPDEGIQPPTWDSNSHFPTRRIRAGGGSGDRRLRLSDGLPERQRPCQLQCHMGCVLQRQAAVHRIERGVSLGKRTGATIPSPTTPRC